MRTHTLNTQWLKNKAKPDSVDVKAPRSYEFLSKTVEKNTKLCSQSIWVRKL